MTLGLGRQTIGAVGVRSPSSKGPFRQLESTNALRGGGKITRAALRPVLDARGVPTAAAARFRTTSTRLNASLLERICALWPTNIRGIRSFRTKDDRTPTPASYVLPPRLLLLPPGRHSYVDYLCGIEPQPHRARGAYWRWYLPVHRADHGESALHKYGGRGARGKDGEDDEFAGGVGLVRHCGGVGVFFPLDFLAADYDVRRRKTVSARWISVSGDFAALRSQDLDNAVSLDSMLAAREKRRVIWIGSECRANSPIPTSKPTPLKLLWSVATWWVAGSAVLAPTAQDLPNTHGNHVGRVPSKPKAQTSNMHVRQLAFRNRSIAFGSHAFVLKLCLPAPAHLASILLDSLSRRSDIEHACYRFAGVDNPEGGACCLQKQSPAHRLGVFSVVRSPEA
ncbi:hypothetical protein B0H10DRAFT_2188006 [Mycena sp. CBHHK59/15]|nr:hypothetical protein B0H10DRAFT_2188006 [Mycena sp. CBHHK59/15]